MGRIKKNLTYIFLSTAGAMLLMFTVLPYYCISPLTIPSTDIYFSYDEVYRFCLFFFPICSFFGAITTLRKRKILEDVLINIVLPMLLIVYLRVCNKFLMIGMIVLLTVTLMTAAKVYDAVTLQNEWGAGKRARHAYYEIRKGVTCLLVVIIVPLALWITAKENTNNFRIHTFFRNYTAAPQEKLLSANLCYQLSGEKEWASEDSLEDKILQLQCVADEFLGELGVTGVPVKMVTTLDDTVLGAYSEIDKKIYINKKFLEHSTLPKAVHVIAHESHHRYQHAIIQSLMILEHADFPYEKLGYYREAASLMEAFKNYAEDKENYYDYLKNEMEVQAEAYAAVKVSEFSEKYGWEIKEIKR